MIEYLPMDDMRHYISKFIATVFFVGLIPFAPGTFGTLAGMIFIWAAKPSFTWQLVILIVTLLNRHLGFWRGRKSLWSKGLRSYRDR